MKEIENRTVNESDFYLMLNKDFIRPVVDYEDKYYVSRDGRILSLNYLRRGRMSWLSSETKTGYHKLYLTKNGVCTYTPIHRVVAKAFIPNPRNLPMVNHINEIKTDNRVENLEWVTHKENLNHGTSRFRIARSKMKKVAQIDTKGRIIKVWNSTKEAGLNGFEQRGVSSCAVGRITHHNGYIWRFVTNTANGRGSISEDDIEKGYVDFKIEIKGIKQVTQYDRDLNFIRTWESVVKTKEAGFKPNSVAHCAQGLTKTHQGYIWRYGV